MNPASSIRRSAAALAADPHRRTDRQRGREEAMAISAQSGSPSLLRAKTFPVPAIGKATGARLPVVLLLLVLILFVLMLSALSCGGSGIATGDSRQTDDPSRTGLHRSRPLLNLILISIDTLRADHLGAYGYRLPTSPRFDAFASRAVRFENCRSASGRTLASHKTILSGRSPASFLAAFSKAGGPPDGQADASAYYVRAFFGWPWPSLARRLQNAGLRTAGFTDAGYMKPRYGFAEGFDEYRSEKVGLAVQRSRAEAWLDAHGGPFFLFVHCYDAHCPYDPPKEFLKPFESECRGRLDFAGHCGKPYFNSLHLTQDERDHIARHYDAGILHVDDELGRFFDFLETSGRFHDTVIIVTSDHGESLGERSHVGHAQLYENQLHVPLVIHAPGVAPGVVRTPVSGADITPTALDLVLGEVPSDLEGLSLRGLLESAGSSQGARTGEGSGARSDSGSGARPTVGSGRRSDAESAAGAVSGVWGAGPVARSVRSGPSMLIGALRPHVESRRPRTYSDQTAAQFESRPRFGSITEEEESGNITRLRKISVEDANGFKLIFDAESGKGELYDLANDPGETRNLFGSGRPEERRLLALVEEHDPGPLRGYDASEKSGPPAMTPEEVEQLRSLGYLP